MTGEKPLDRPLTEKEKQAALEAGRRARGRRPGARAAKDTPAVAEDKPKKKTGAAKKKAEKSAPRGTPEDADGEGRLKDLFDAAEATAPCPVTVLGHHGGTIFYLGAAREFRAIESGRHGPAAIEQLFGGDLDWLSAAFPGQRRELYDLGSLRPWLFRQAHQAGLFDPNTPVRGPGVWRGPGDTLVVHAGDAMQVDGAWGPAGRELDGAIYAAAAKVQRPADTAAEKAAGQALLEGVKLWRFESDIGAELVLGFLGAAMLGGAPAWRVHMLTIGRPGSGKTWLSDLVQAALGGGALDANNATEAGLRQALTGQARALILDEAESDETTATRIQAVIQLLRLMSGGAGAKTLRGSAGGVSQAFTVTGCAYLAAVLPPVLLHQDRTRITTVRLARLPSGVEAAGARERALAAITAARTAGPALRARAIAGWPRFLVTLERYRCALLEWGVDPRDCDRIATLMAGRDLLTCDDPPDPLNVHEERDRFLELVVEAAETEDESEGQQCLAQLYTWPADLWRSGERETVAEMVMEGLRGMGGAPARRQLEKLGLRLRDWPDRAEDAPGEARLLVANRHAALERIFRDTRWAGGRWAEALRYLPRVTASKRPERFAGVPARATVIPAALLPVDDHRAPPDEDTPEVPM